MSLQDLEDLNAIHWLPLMKKNCNASWRNAIELVYVASTTATDKLGGDAIACTHLSSSMVLHGLLAFTMPMRKSLSQTPDFRR